MASRCTMPGCSGKLVGRGLCNKHYLRLCKHGDPNILLKPHGEAKAFVEDLVQSHDQLGDDCIIWPFCRDGDGYGRVLTGKSGELAHRKILRPIQAPPGPGYEAAHSCQNGHAGCVNPRHLRWATHFGNMADKWPQMRAGNIQARNRRVYRHIKDTLGRGLPAPSITQIGVDLGLPSPQEARRAVIALERQGLIERGNTHFRIISLPQKVSEKTE